MSPPPTGPRAATTRRLPIAALSFLVLAAFVLAPAPVPTAPQSFTKGQWYSRLGAAFEARNWSGLESHARAALQAFPRESGFESYHLMALRELGRREEAAKLAREYLSASPGDAQRRKRLGQCLLAAAGALEKGEPTKAAPYYREALSLDDSRAYVHAAYGRALARSGDRTGAAQHLERARDRFVDDRGVSWALVEVYRQMVAGLREGARKGDAAARAELAPLALRVFARVRADRPVLHGRPFLRLAGGIFVELEDPTGLDGMLARLRKSHPTDSDGFQETARLQRRLFDRSPKRFAAYYEKAVGNLNEAIRIYEQAHPRRPPVADALLPLAGVAVVINASETTYTHYGYNKYCYDFLGADEKGEMLRPNTRGDRVEDYVGFGRLLRAILPGRVVDVTDDFPDRPIGQQAPDEVRIEHGEGRVSVYLHNRQRTARVRRGDSVQSGSPIAQTGNSGWTLSPHVHFCVYDAAGVSLPVRFRGVRVRRPGNVAWEPHPGPYEKGWLLRAE